MQIGVAIAAFTVVFWLSGQVFFACVAAYFAYTFFRESEHGSSVSAPDSTDRELSSFAIALFEVLGYAAKSDGKVAKSEIAVVEQIIKSFGLSSDQRKAAIACFNRGKAKTDFDALARNLARETNADSDIKQLTMGALIEVTAADGFLTQQEEQVLRQVHASLMPVKIVLEDVITSLRDNSPYGVLGLTPPADLAAIKAAYRKKCVEFHPDHLDQKKLPPELRAFAAERMKLIQEAYEHLSAEFA